MKARPLFTLAAMAFGALGVGGLQAASSAPPPDWKHPEGQHPNSNRYARKLANESIVQYMLEDSGCAIHRGYPPPASWIKPNQRQIRLRRRRRHAGGDKKAFR